MRGCVLAMILASLFGEGTAMAQAGSSMTPPGHGKGKGTVQEGKRASDSVVLVEKEKRTAHPSPQGLSEGESSDSKRSHPEEVQPNAERSPEDRSPDGGPKEKGASKPHGEYSGVTPGKIWLPPKAPPSSERPLLIWAGFMMTESGSRVFLQLTKQAPYEVASSGKGVTLFIRGAKIYKKNNSRPVDTSHFSTPVVRVQAKQRGKDIAVSISLREPVTPKLSVQEGEGGYRFIMVDFPQSEKKETSVPSGRAYRQDTVTSDAE